MIPPSAWQFPEFTVCRIKYGNIEIKSQNFKESKWCQRQLFETIDSQVGSIEIFYLKAFTMAFEGPFLEEERYLIINLANLITGYLNSIKGKAILRKTGYADITAQRAEEGTGNKIKPETSPDLS